MANNQENNKKNNTMLIVAGLGIGLYLLTRTRPAVAQYPTYAPTPMPTYPTPTLAPIPTPIAPTPIAGITYKDEHFGISVPWDKISGFFTGLLGTDEQKEGVAKTTTSLPTVTQPLTMQPQPIIMSPSMTN